MTKLNLEVGKKYLNRDNRVVLITKVLEREDMPISFDRGARFVDIWGDMYTAGVHGAYYNPEDLMNEIARHSYVRSVDLIES